MNRISKLFFVLLFGLMFNGCTAMTALSALDKVNPLKDDKSIDATLQLGKNNQKTNNKSLAQIQQDTTVTSKNDISAQSVTQNTVMKDSTWLIIALALSVPSPIHYIISSRRIKKLEDRNDELRKSLELLRQSVRDEIRQRPKDTKTELTS